jgi:hypothetical protein
VKFGTVVRRSDGLLVMVIAPGNGAGVLTNEGVLAEEDDYVVVLVLARGSHMTTEYWPLHDTACLSPDYYDRPGSSFSRETLS